jgi:predicted phosphodiesterase
VREACAKYPDMPALTMAKWLVRDNPGVWGSVDTCRGAVRYQYGVQGKKNRAQITTTPRPKRSSGEDWRKYLPEPKRTIELPWGPVTVGAPCKALILSDLHVPFYDRKAAELAIEYGVKRDADCVILNGDIVDHYALSRWQRDPRLRRFDEEVRDGRALLKSMRSAFPDAAMYWKLGNHEERYEAYMISQAPDFLGVEAFEWGSVFGLDEQGVTLVTDKRPLIMGKLYVIHGHEFMQGYANPVNPARGFFLKAKTHVLGGHYHQSSQHSEKALDDNVVSAWSTGCLCEDHPAYRPINNWSQGFAFVEIDERGAFQVDNKRIIDGKVW